MQRFISFIPTIAFEANLQAAWESVAVSFQAGLLNGGPVSPHYYFLTRSELMTLQDVSRVRNNHRMDRIYSNSCLTC